MITCKLFGRTGNQLFILATAISFAKRHKIKFTIPQHITCPPGLPSDPIYFTHFPKPDFDINILPEWKELADQSYMEIPEAMAGAPFCLNGYFQSYKYFQDQRKEVLKALEPAFTMRSAGADEGKGWVSIHVRRGDFLDKPDCHPPLVFEYYSRAIDLFKAKGFLKFIVFSDDIPRARYFFSKGMFPKQRFLFSTNQSAIEDLQSMKVCEHHIIANSSFSWWGAWLNENRDKIVVAPKTWFGPALSHINTKDLIPEQWIRI